MEHGTIIQSIYGIERWNRGYRMKVSCMCVSEKVMVPTKNRKYMDSRVVAKNKGAHSVRLAPTPSLFFVALSSYFHLHIY